MIRSFIEPFLKKQSGPNQPISSLYYKVLVYSLLTFLSFGIILLFFGKTEQTIQVQGKLLPLGSIYEIQAANGGVIKEILISEGDYVQKDEVLILMDDSLEQKKLNILNEQIQAKENQIIFKEEQKKAVQESYANQKIRNNNLQFIENEKLDSLQKLKDSGAISRFQLMDQKSRVQQLVDDEKVIVSQGLLEVSSLNNEISRINQELLELRKQRSTTIKAIHYLTLTSPQEGYVFDLVTTKPNYVSSPAELLLKIVPTAILIADVNIPSNKIGFVNKGAQVEVSIDAFPASDFGTLRGKIISISSSSLPADNEYNFIRYPATIDLDNQFLETNVGSSLKLRPGMTISANITLRKASYFQLIFTQFDKSLKSLTTY